MFQSLLGRKLVSRVRAARRVALIVSLFAVAALPHVNAGAQQQQKQSGGAKSDAANAGINTQQSEKPAAKAVAVEEPGEAQAVTVCAQSQPINFGQVISGSLSEGDCSNPFRNARADEYTFDGAAGQSISISMWSTNFDTYLYLLSSDGAVLTHNDDVDGGLNSRIPPSGTFTLPHSGTYSIIASSYASSERGNYNLMLTAGASCRSLIAYGETKQGTLVADDCINPFRNARADEYIFSGTAGEQISISMSSTNFDTYLYLLFGGTVVALNDDTGYSLNSRIPFDGYFTLPHSGIYSILASSFAPGEQGAYNLTLNRRMLTISGQITGGGVGLSGATVYLSGREAYTTTTDANGNYSFANRPAGDSYSIWPPDTAHYSFTPQSVAALQTDQTVNFNGSPHIIISEFRFRGTNGATDEFVELYNQTDQPRDITGWSLVSGGTVLHTVASGLIPPRGHYLIAGASYSLPAAADGALLVDIPDKAAVALFTNSHTFASGPRIDAVGFSAADTFYTEGGGLSPASGITTDSEHAFVRKLTSGVPQDTDNNAADFVLVATDPPVVGHSAVLGAPGAENRTSPTQRFAAITASLIDPQCSGFGSVTSGCSRVRTAAGANPTTAQYGTLRIRRKFTNTTESTVTTLRFRVIGITTLGSPGAGSGQADLRVVSSSPADFNVTLTDGSVVPVKGTQVETPLAQPNGGGLNSTLITITTATPIAVGDSVNVEFTLGVQQQGAFSFFVNVETLAAPPNGGALEATQSDATKSADSHKEK
jgi:hypothetical protein